MWHLAELHSSTAQPRRKNMQLNSIRNRRQVLNLVQELDAFPKVPETYQHTTAAGGGMSLIVFLIIAVLVVSEIRYYSSRQLKFDYDVDPQFEGKLQLNIDITVAMKCMHVGADILDLTGQNTETFGHLSEEDTYFELSPEQQSSFNMLQRVNSYLRKEYHALYDTLWSSNFKSPSTSLPRRELLPNEPANACRLHGTMTVNKVAGNFHITAGKSVPVFPRGHAHMSMMMHETDYNFSHRIVQFSFGEPTGGIVNPLEGEEKVISDHNHMFQYFLQIVPTKVDTLFSTVETYQYATTESNRTISHDRGSHGVPGIFVKYDLSSIRVHIRETHQPYWQFMVRLCGIVGGIFATSGLLNLLVEALVNVVCCRIGPRRHQNENNLQGNQVIDGPNQMRVASLLADSL